MIKSLLKSVLKRFGVVAFKRRSGLYLPEDEMPQFVQRLCGKPEPLVVDGGAHRGDFVRAIRRALPQARFVCFEPEPELSVALREQFKHDTHVQVVAKALGERSGQASFNRNQAKATSSLLPGSAQATGLLRELVTTQESFVVDLVTVDEALAELGHDGADIVKLDLQGFDYPALLGAGKTLGKASVVVVEVWFAPIYVGAADYLSVCQLMADRGFALFALTSLHYGASDRLLWGDAVFVPRNSAAWAAPITH
jgi:FkbM family methyltransferase